MPFTATQYEPYDFANRRHIGPSPSEMAEMFAVLGVSSLDELIDQTVPKSIRQDAALEFDFPKSERELIWYMRQVAKKNQVFTTMIGQGYYGTVTPPAIQRNIMENPAWYTAYTPYQPEISQGRLEALLNYQTMVRDLTGRVDPTRSDQRDAALGQRLRDRSPRRRALVLDPAVGRVPQRVVLLARPLDVIDGGPRRSHVMSVAPRTWS